MFENVLEQKGGKTLLFGKEVTIIGEETPEQEINPQEILKQQKYEKSGVSKKFFNVSLANYKVNTEEEQKARFETRLLINEIKDGGTDKILLLYGAYGTGKTHLGCSVVRECGGCYRTAFKLIIEYENCSNFHATENKVQMLERYSNEKVLVIDEIGRGIKSDTEREILSYIISQRYENQLPTVLITNMEKEELIKFLGHAIYDRFTECCMSVHFTGKSKRGEMRHV